MLLIVTSTVLEGNLIGFIEKADWHHERNENQMEILVLN